jgi:hypothetical protein
LKRVPKSSRRFQAMFSTATILELARSRQSRTLDAGVRTFLAQEDLQHGQGEPQSAWSSCLSCRTSTNRFRRSHVSVYAESMVRINPAVNVQG